MGASVFELLKAKRRIKELDKLLFGAATQIDELKAEAQAALVEIPHTRGQGGINYA